ncbi:hydrophobin 2 [Gloeophyllum trabeum ATCC 11539]|uniref:Hydrophobin n=1 Tax=Gloeophyllum trabeum (strain ATCC 11539 / FP-39264 / Madison 617) TaxID=670483 RepID=S7Q3R9_GLOTA|nr:hydrophobin 2 [Gloeophyllum trabeum ATCC 11539]EPQ54192.1 hydrophobin 2 [Gloeophyllum trabeum ATCC 11539]
MFSKLSLAITGALAILAAATHAPNEPASQCPTGELQCCNSVGSATDPTIATVLGSLGIPVQGVSALVGLTCSAVSVVGVGSGGSWQVSATPVCCTDNSYAGLVSLGCVPVSA